MTREHKLALIVGFSLFLVLGVLISDHFSKARQVEMAEGILPATAKEMGAQPPGVRVASEPGVVGGASAPVVRQPTTVVLSRPDLVPLPVIGGGIAGGGGTTPSPNGTQLVVAPPRTGPSVALAGTHETRFPPNGDSHFDPPGPGVPVLPPAPPTVQIPLQRHEVKEGDTLYRIAVKYYGEGKLWEKVRDYNKDRVISGGGLREGVTLMLPPKDVLLGKPYMPPTSQTPLSSIEMGRPTGSVVDTSKNTVKPDITKPAGDYREYTVKDGDTLVAISRKMLSSGKRYNEIIEANRGTLSDPEALTVGMKLRIPAK